MAKTKKNRNTKNPQNLIGKVSHKNSKHKIHRYKINRHNIKYTNLIGKYRLKTHKYVRNGTLNKLNYKLKNNKNNKHYSHNDILGTQKGGMFNIIKHWINMRKFKSLIEKLHKEEKDISKNLGTYQANSEFFKTSLEEMRDKSTEYVLNKRQFIIGEMSIPKNTIISVNNNNRETKKNFLEYTKVKHKIGMAENKAERLKIDINNLNSDIMKREPGFNEDKRKFEKKTEKFRNLVEKLSTSDLGNFQSKTLNLKKTYDILKKQPQDSLKSSDKKIIKEYEKHSADYDKVASITETYIDEQQKTLNKINELLQTTDFYKDSIDPLSTSRTNMIADLKDWEYIYKTLFVVIDEIIEHAEKITLEIKKIEEYEFEIMALIEPIAGSSTNKDLKKASEQMKLELSKISKTNKTLEAIINTVREIKKLMLSEKLGSEIYEDSNEIPASAMLIEKNLKELQVLVTYVMNLRGGAVPVASINIIEDKEFDETFLNDTNNQKQENLFISIIDCNTYKNKAKISDINDIDEAFKILNTNRSDIKDTINIKKINALSIVYLYQTDATNTFNNINYNQNYENTSKLTYACDTKIIELFNQSLINIYQFVKTHKDKIKNIYFDEFIQKCLDDNIYGDFIWVYKNNTDIKAKIDELKDKIKELYKATPVPPVPPVPTGTAGTATPIGTAPPVKSTTGPNRSIEINKIIKGPGNNFDDYYNKFHKPNNNNPPALFIYFVDKSIYIKNDNNVPNLHSSDNKYRQDISTITENDRYSLGIPTETSKCKTALVAVNSIKRNTFTLINNLIPIEHKDINELFNIAISNIIYFINDKKITDIYIYYKADNPDIFLGNQWIKQYSDEIYNSIKFMKSNYTIIEHEYKKISEKLTPQNGALGPTIGGPQPNQLQQPQLQQPQLQITATEINASKIIPNINKDNNFPINNSHFIINADDGTVIDESTPNNTEFIIGNKKAILQKPSNGKFNLYFNPTYPENNPINIVIKLLKKEEKNGNLNPKILELVNVNMLNIQNIINNIVPNTGSLNLKFLVSKSQELSSLLIRLKRIEPKVIKLNIKAPTPLSQQYSWIIKPVEVTKGQPIEGAITLRKLIKEDAELKKFVKEKDISILSDIDVNNLLNLIVFSTNYRYNEKEIAYIKAQSKSQDFIDRINKQIPEKDRKTMSCNIFKNLSYSVGQYDNNLYKQEYEKHCVKQNNPIKKNQQYNPYNPYNPYTPYTP